MSEKVAYVEQIREAEGLYGALRADKAKWNSEHEVVLGLMEMLWELWWNQVHRVLIPQNTVEGENEVRRHIKVAHRLLLDCERKLSFLKVGNEKEAEVVNRYMKVYDNLYALVSCRSLEHMSLYLEWDKPENEKVWAESMDVLRPIFHYSNIAVLDRSYRFVAKRLPTGTGKSFSDAFIIAFIFGQDINADVLKVVGNPKLVSATISTVVQLMTSKRYAKVFPNFRKFHEMEGKLINNMFKICSYTDGELSIVGSSKPFNLLCISKETPIDGVRVQFLFLDDICRAKDAGNIKEHDKDIERFDMTWFKRNYDLMRFVIFIGGTAYSIYDIISRLIRRYSNNTFRETSFKHAFTNEKGDAVFIAIPKLDYETDQSLFPKKFPTSLARIDRARDYHTFMAMEQQKPLPPEGTPFYWDRLQIYENIPKEGRLPYCWASIDPPRTGKNFLAMGIKALVEDKNGKIGHFLVDCVFRRETFKDCLGDIVAKVEKHHITKLLLEINVETSGGALLKEKFRQRGINYCEIVEKYTWENKDNKIAGMKTEIIANNWYPKEELYARSSEMGQYMENMVTYSFTQKNDFDDAIDNEAMYTADFIPNKPVENRMQILNMR